MFNSCEQAVLLSQCYYVTLSISFIQKLPGRRRGNLEELINPDNADHPGSIIYVNSKHEQFTKVGTFEPFC